MNGGLTLHRTGRLPPLRTPDSAYFPFFLPHFAQVP